MHLNVPSSFDNTFYLPNEKIKYISDASLNSYAGYTTSNSISIGKWKGYKSTSLGCKTYGICYAPVGNSGFAFSKTSVRYKKITFNSTAIKTYLSSQKNNMQYNCKG